AADRASCAAASVTRTHAGSAVTTRDAPIDPASSAVAMCDTMIDPASSAAAMYDTTTALANSAVAMGPVSVGTLTNVGVRAGTPAAMVVTDAASSVAGVR